jgi:hypothetical protein
MQSGSMPVELVRASLTRQTLSEKFTIAWRFAGL